MSIIQSNPTLYSKNQKFISDFGNVEPKERFILTGKGSKPEGRGRLIYYWKLLRGKAPAIVEILDEGQSIKFIAPEDEGEIEFELKIKDGITEETDKKNIIINVTSSALTI